MEISSASSLPRERRAIIIGAGLCGPAVALALEGIACVKCTIYESYDRPTNDVGSYFTITNNGVAVLDQLGIRSAVEAIAIPTHGGQMRNDAQTLLGTMKWTALLPGADESQRPVALTVKRPSLNRLLCEEAQRRGVNVHFNKKFVSATYLGDSSVRAVFSDGSVSEAADLLIGADGIHSAVRSWLDPTKAPTGRYIGLVNFAGEIDQSVFNCSQLRMPLDATPGYWQFLFGKSAFFLYLTPNSPTDKLVWGVNCPRDAPFSLEERRDVFSRDNTSVDRCKTFVKMLFDGDQCRDMVAAMVDASTMQLFGDATFDLPHVPVWTARRVILVGDAVHAPAPTSGQGASMALEDAVLLAKALRDISDPEAACRAFARYRRPRVEQIVAHGAKFSTMKTPGPVGRRIRDIMLPLVFKYLMSEKDVAWIYNFRIDLATTLDEDSANDAAAEQKAAVAARLALQRRMLFLASALVAVISVVTVTRKIGRV